MDMAHQNGDGVHADEPLTQQDMQRPVQGMVHADDDESSGSAEVADYDKSGQ